MIGANMKFLILKAEAGDVGAQEHLASTIPQSVFPFDAFLVLSKSRIGGAIPISEIVKYIDFLGVTSEKQKNRLMRAIQALDIEYREFSSSG